MDFAYPSHLLLLVSVAVVGFLWWLSRMARRRKLSRFGHLDILQPMMPDASRYKPAVKITLQLLAVAALVMVLARPRYGEKESRQSRVNGIEIMIAFDLSNSMLASSTDNPGDINRLDRAKLLLEKLLSKLNNDQVGLVVFAGEAKTQMPITPDFYTAKMYLNDLTPEMMTVQGTAIADAINLSVNSFSQDSKVGKAVILITDAENHEGDAVEAAAAAAKKGIQVDVIGVGTAKGGAIPLDASGTNLMKDNEGNVVITKIDEAAAMKIAKAGKGIYVNGASSKAFEDLYASLDNLDKSEFKRVEYKASAEQFPTFAWIALILLLADLFVLDRKIGWLKNINLFSKNAKKD